MGIKDRLLKNYINARTSWECWTYLSGAKINHDKIEFNAFVNDDKLMKHLRYISMKDFFVEMYKVLKKSKNNDANIFELIQDKFKDSNIEVFEKAILDLNTHNEIIKVICDTRDKYYAHLDSEFEDYVKGNIPLKSYIDLLISIEQILIKIYGQLEFEKAIFPIPSYDDFDLHKKIKYNF